MKTNSNKGMFDRVYIFMTMPWAISNLVNMSFFIFFLQYFVTITLKTENNLLTKSKIM